MEIISMLSETGANNWIIVVGVLEDKNTDYTKNDMCDYFHVPCQDIKKIAVVILEPNFDADLHDIRIIKNITRNNCLKLFSSISEALVWTKS